MSEAEQVYSSRQLAALLGLGSAMLRRYAVSYEQVTGSQLQLDRRDGRIFAQRDVDVLLRARQLVATQGLPVDTAIKTALDGPELLSVAAVSAPAVSAEALAAVLSNAITEAQRPLLGELQSMNHELQALRAEVEALRKNANRSEQPEPQLTQPEPTITSQHSAVVRLVLWIEQRLKG